MTESVNTKSQERKIQKTMLETERFASRRDTGFQNGVLNFETRQFINDRVPFRLAGNYLSDSNGVYESLEILEFIRSTITQKDVDGTPMADPDDCLRSLQRSLGGALFLPNPYPSVISIVGNTPRFVLMEILKRALDERCVHLGPSDLERFTGVPSLQLSRLSQARLVFIDIPRRVTEAEKERLVGLLFQSTVTAGDLVEYTFSGIPVLFTPDEACSMPDGICNDPTAVQAFTLIDNERTSLSCYRHLNDATAPGQLDRFLRWLLDGALLEQEFRKEPENLPLAHTDLQ